jgi:hypothetical protein
MSFSTASGAAHHLARKPNLETTQRVILPGRRSHLGNFCETVALPYLANSKVGSKFQQANQAMDLKSGSILEASERSILRRFGPPLPQVPPSRGCRGTQTPHFAFPLKHPVFIFISIFKPFWAPYGKFPKRTAFCSLEVVSYSPSTPTILQDQTARTLEFAYEVIAGTVPNRKIWPL